MFGIVGRVRHSSREKTHIILIRTINPTTLKLSKIGNCIVILQKKFSAHHRDTGNALLILELEFRKLEIRMNREEPPSAVSQSGRHAYTLEYTRKHTNTHTYVHVNVHRCVYFVCGCCIWVFMHEIQRENVFACTCLCVLCVFMCIYFLVFIYFYAVNRSRAK